jgi:GDP-L-fucose synthase
MYLGTCLEANNWNAINSDLDKRPVEGIKGTNSEQEKLHILGKYGISKGDTVTVTLWGTGSPRREFLYSEDMADACVYIMETCDFKDLVRNPKEIRNTHINIGTGTDLTIKELAEMVKSVVGFGGQLIWDSTKPDGTMQKLQNVDKLRSLGWKEKISLEQGIKTVFELYRQ